MLNGKEVRVLRDTGCTGVVVRRSLVSDGQMLNKQSGVTHINDMTHFSSGVVNKKKSRKDRRKNRKVKVADKFIRQNRQMGCSVEDLLISIHEPLSLMILSQILT